MKDEGGPHFVVPSRLFLNLPDRSELRTIPLAVPHDMSYPTVNNCFSQYEVVDK